MLGAPPSQARAALEWLAGLHACFWEQPRPPGVWEQGCYWYLDTRRAPGFRA